ncbi:hypothetical protein B0T19DRAFT_398739 [Cercophora scortea]|uniref:CCHC-type domain-containing protein n=1 Tax=Cercophora scortea TaxID=314031 RepID=A0AAE0IXQ9_9PEZI|nr:hypothetical protein B0T19DRAFT_398739 [Cercophora scortea]
MAAKLLAILSTSLLFYGISTALPTQEIPLGQKFNFYAWGNLIPGYTVFYRDGHAFLTDFATANKTDDLLPVSCKSYPSPLSPSLMSSTLTLAFPQPPVTIAPGKTFGWEITAYPNTTGPVSNAATRNPPFTNATFYVSSPTSNNHEVGFLLDPPSVSPADARTDGFMVTGRRAVMVDREPETGMGHMFAPVFCAWPTADPKVYSLVWNVSAPVDVATPELVEGVVVGTKIVPRQLRSVWESWESWESWKLWEHAVTPRDCLVMIAGLEIHCDALSRPRCMAQAFAITMRERVFLLVAVSRTRQKITVSGLELTLTTSILTDSRSSMPPSKAPASSKDIPVSPSGDQGEESVAAIRFASDGIHLFPTQGDQESASGVTTPEPQPFDTHFYSRQGLCGNCHEPGHRVRDCVKQSPLGDIAACSFCNHDDHIGSDCPYKGWWWEGNGNSNGGGGVSAVDKWGVCWNPRVGLPPLRLREDLFDLARVELGRERLQGCPLTRSQAQAWQWENPADWWRTYDHRERPPVVTYHFKGPNGMLEKIMSGSLHRQGWVPPPGDS